MRCLLTATASNQDILENSMTLPFDVPTPRARGIRRLSLALQTVTPILGGGVVTRTVDAVDIIRSQTLRGQLRFWWRAVTADADSPAALYRRETALWGGIADNVNGEASQTVKKSLVRISVQVESPAALPDIEDHNIGGGAPGAYALWPAREQRSNGTPPAQRRKPGVKFRLTLSFPVAYEEEVQRTLSAWLCFGGYGSRSRRGLGKVAPACDESRARVPTAATVQELTRLLGPQALRSSDHLTDWPRLLGGQIAVGSPSAKGEHAWLSALAWLNEFRQQGPNQGRLGNHNPAYARRRGVNTRPSISNWPEADKVRQLSRAPARGWSHAPQHNAVPMWPRAAFGLPILAQFQRKARDGSRLSEPLDFQLQWELQGELHDRLASPLIVGGMPLNGGKFVPFALWLGRGYPEQGQVVAVRKGPTAAGYSPILGSHAAFDELVAAGDTAMYAPLTAGQAAAAGLRLRTAFFTWLTQKHPNVRLLEKSE